jgi:protoheme IX farnesyltransferase
MDALMTRTKNRALARQLISPKRALLFALCLGLAGTFLLAVFCNLLTMCVALFGFLVYVLLYSYFKYHSMHATLVGSLAGAVPPVVGYCAVSNRLDAAAALLFLLLVLWQMPHFYAIAIYRLEDYTAARIPVLPIQKGIEKARVHMFLYVAAFLVLSCTLPLFHRVGWGYLCTMSLLAITWLGICLCGFFARNHKSWARTMFRFSLLVIVGFCAALACCS